MKIRPFWRQIIGEIHTGFGIVIVPSLSVCLLRLHLKFSESELILVNNLLVAARMLIAKYWLQEEVPTIYDWHIKCQFVFLMNKLTAIKRA